MSATLNGFCPGCGQPVAFHVALSSVRLSSGQIVADGLVESIDHICPDPTQDATPEPMPTPPHEFIPQNSIPRLCVCGGVRLDPVHTIHWTPPLIPGVL